MLRRDLRLAGRSLLLVMSGAGRPSGLAYGNAVTIAPSTCAFSPETYDAAGESRNAPKRPNSIGSP